MKMSEPSTASIDAIAAMVMKNGWPDLSLGYRFCPTDAELLVGFLAKKIKKLPLPSYDVIFNVNFYNYTPDRLAAKYDDRGEKQWYFFTEREMIKHKGSTRPKRALATGEGYWARQGNAEAVIYEGFKVGSKRCMAFYQQEPTGKESMKTHWLMSEYTIDTPFTGNADIVLCKIYMSQHSRQAPASAPSQKRSDNIPDSLDLELNLKCLGEVSPPRNSRFKMKILRNLT